MRGPRYTTLSPAALADEFSAIARDAASLLGRYDASQVNWLPDAASWSIAQCFDHLLKANDEMSQAISRALDGGGTPTVWHRLPLWPRLFGWMLITSQAPGGKQKYAAHANALPASRDIAPHTIERFIASQEAAIVRMRDISAE